MIPRSSEQDGAAWNDNFSVEAALMPPSHIGAAENGPIRDNW